MAKAAAAMMDRFISAPSPELGEFYEAIGDASEHASHNALISDLGLRRGDARRFHDAYRGVIVHEMRGGAVQVVYHRDPKELDLEVGFMLEWCSRLVLHAQDAHPTAMAAVTCINFKESRLWGEVINRRE